MLRHASIFVRRTCNRLNCHVRDRKTQTKILWLRFIFWFYNIVGCAILSGVTATCAWTEDGDNLWDPAVMRSPAQGGPNPTVGAGMNDGFYYRYVGDVDPIASTLTITIQFQRGLSLFACSDIWQPCINHWFYDDCQGDLSGTVTTWFNTTSITANLPEVANVPASTT